MEEPEDSSNDNNTSQQYNAAFDFGGGVDNGGDNAEQRSVLVERDAAGRPTGYMCGNAVKTKADVINDETAWQEFYRQGVEIVQYYEFLYDCDAQHDDHDGNDNFLVNAVATVSAALLQDVATAYDLIPSGTACLEHADSGVLHGVSTTGGQNNRSSSSSAALIHQVGCSVLPYARRDQVSLLSSSSTTAVVTTAQCCQVARLDLHVLPPSGLPPSDELQRAVRAYVQDHLNNHHRTTPRTDTTTQKMPMIRTLAIPDPLLLSSSSSSPSSSWRGTGSTGAATNHNGSKNASSSSLDKNGSRRLTILAGTFTAVLVILSLLIVGYRRRRRRRYMFHHTRMMDHQYDHPYEWNVDKPQQQDQKKNGPPQLEDEEVASTTLDPDSSDYSSMSNSWTNGIGSTNPPVVTAAAVTVPMATRSAATAASVPVHYHHGSTAAVLRAAVVGTTTTQIRPPTTSDGLYRPAVTTTTTARSPVTSPRQQPQQSHHYPCRAMGPAAACLGDLSSMREHMFWPTRTCTGVVVAYGNNGNGRAVGCPAAPWDVDDISEADSWAQTDATVGSLEDRLESITAEI